MSGGFFRGTSADQDTRFSNKQAKLLKSQKFAPELDQLVDMAKIKMDVIKPWIANRATELLGFEDEVLINFIYGLLDGKVVDGKQIQIQLTGFMEKNTGKFMKELWSLLLSAQKNVSGVPQQFLDAKEEETRKKKAEADRITHEIQKKKEKEARELELEKQKKMDSEGDVSRAMDAASDPIGRHSVPRASSFGLEEEREVDGRHGSRGRSRHSKSPPIVRHSPSPRRSTPSAVRSSSKSFSRSRSYSEERQKSRSVSVSPQPRRRSISPERRFRSTRRRSPSPRRKHSPWNPRSPPRRRSPHSRRRSTSRSRRRSPSPIRRRSPPPMRRRSPSPMRRRSPSPVRRRSPIAVRRRSPPPPRRRSPSPRWRSPSPRWRWSPSPLRRRSPLLRSPRHRRRSPVWSPRRRVVDSQMSPGERNRSRSPYTSHSPHRSRRSLSRERDSRANGLESKRNIDDYASQRAPGKRSPVRHTLEKEVERHGSGRKGTDSISRQPPISLRSPQRDPKDRNDVRHKMPALSPPPENSPSQSGSPPRRRRTSPIEDRMPSPASPARRTRERATRHDSPERSIDEEEISHGREDAGKKADSLRKRIRHSPTVGSRKKPTSKGSDQEEDSPDKFVVSGSSEARGRMDYTELKKKELAQRSDKASMKTDRTSHISEEIEYGPGRLDNFPQDHGHDKQSSAKQLVRDLFSPDERLSNQQVLSRKTNSREDYRGKEKKHPFSSDDEYSDLDRKTEALSKSTKKAGRNDRMGAADSDSEKKESYRKDMERRKLKRSDSRERALDNEAAYDSQVDERKEAKRRRKEDKKLRKEERRRKREERHRRREERRAEKLKAKSIDTVTPPSDFENNQNDAGDSDGDVAEKKDLNASDSEEMESEQKKLEIELRKKALESLRAKKLIISSDESRRFNAVESAFQDPESIAKAIGNASKVVITIGPFENGPTSQVTTSDALQVIQGAQLAGVGHVAVIYNADSTSIASTYNVLDGITSFFNNFFTRSQSLTLTEFLAKVVETDVSYTLIKASLTEEYSTEYSNNVVLKAEGATTDTEYKVSKSQIASLVAGVFANTSVAENKVVEVSTNPSAPSKPIDELFSAIPEDGRRKAYAEALAKAKAEEEALRASEKAREAEAATKKLEEEVKKLSEQEARATSLAEEAREKAEAAGSSLEGLVNRAKGLGSGFSWEKLSSQIATAVSEKDDDEKPKVQIASVRGQAKARTLMPKKAVVKPPPLQKPKTKPAEPEPEVRKVFGGLFKQETIYMDDD